MKRLMIAAAMLTGLTAQAHADTISREGKHGTGVVTRSTSDGVYTADKTWTGKNGGIYEQSTTCADRKCETDWTFTGQDDRVTSSSRKTVWGKRGSRTSVETEGPGGRTWNRTVLRRR